MSTNWKHYKITADSNSKLHKVPLCFVISTQSPLCCNSSHEIFSTWSAYVWNERNFCELTAGYLHHKKIKLMILAYMYVCKTPTYPSHKPSNGRSSLCNHTKKIKCSWKPDIKDRSTNLVNYNTLSKTKILDIPGINY